MSPVGTSLGQGCQSRVMAVAESAITATGDGRQEVLLAVPDEYVRWTRSGRAPHCSELVSKEWTSWSGYTQCTATTPSQQRPVQGHSACQDAA